jgi:hypothetical protein
MIISHKHKIIFIKTTKTAGTSFEIAFSQFCGKSDVITPVLNSDEKIRRKIGAGKPRNYRYTIKEILTAEDYKSVAKELLRKRLPMKYYNHIPADKIKNNIKNNTWEEYKKIGIIRDPYDHIVSRFFWKRRNRDDFPDFRGYVLRNPGDLVVNQEILGMPGSPIDFFIRYENLFEDIKYIEAENPDLEGLAKMLSSIQAKGGVRPPDSSSIEDMFKNNEDLIELVRILCAPTIYGFNYEIPSP